MGTHAARRCPRSENIAAALGLLGHPACPEVTVGRTWQRDGVEGRELFWSVDDGPHTEAWLLRPAGEDGDLPGVLLLHGHDGVKFHGKEKVADGPDGIADGIADLRRRGYDGLCVADGLVRAGFAVLVHDVFGWGSRRVAWEDLPSRAVAAGFDAVPRGRESDSDRRRRYEAAAREHEHGLAKIAVLTGTSLAGRALVEDLVALSVLRDRSGVDAARVGVSGFSVGGARGCHLLACAPGLVRGGVITASMSTFADIAKGHADDTSWWMVTPGLPAVCDWPDLLTVAPTRVLVQFAQFDAHFGEAGMREAESVLRSARTSVPCSDSAWYPEPHRFSAAMQADAASWLSAVVAPHALDSGL